MATRGLRDMGSGPEPIADEVERAAVRAQARRLVLESLAATVLVCSVLWLLP